MSPKEVRYDETHVYITWSDGHEGTYAAKRLREECPCAVCKGERGLIGETYLPASTTRIPDDVRVVRHTLVGRYALSFEWSDGHATGIYPYDYLILLCECKRCLDARGSGADGTSGPIA